MLKNKNNLIFMLLLSFSIALIIVVYPGFVNAASRCEQGELRCNTRMTGYLQECKNCDRDEDLEWCNIKNCAEDSQVCIKGSCQGNITCGPGQLNGDLNSDSRINDLDVSLIKYVILGRIEKPSDLCCIDMNKDNIIDEADILILNNVVAGQTASPENCPMIEEPGEVIKTICVINNICEEGENIDNCPDDCAPKKDTSIINRTTIFIAIFLVVILVVIYLIFGNKKENIE